MARHSFIGIRPFNRLASGLVSAATSLVVAALSSLPLVAAAQSYPSKPLRVIVPFAAGSATDTVARIYSQKMGELLGQTLVVDNRAGANGSIGADMVAKAPADGYTILVGTNTTNAAINSLMKKVPFDFEKDFAPVSFLGSIPLLVCENNDVPAKNLKELIALARAKPGTYMFATASASQRVSSEMLASMTGMKLVHVPYKSSPNAVTDLMSGQVQIFTADLAVTLPQVKAGKIRALAVTSTQRTALAPEVPTVNEAADLKAYELIAWFGVFAPAATPRDVIARLNDSVKRSADARDLRERFAPIGLEVASSTPEQLAARVKTEAAKWSKAMNEAGIEPE
jgi:tripartite-type tricarboxylate transporter receptor subunit TctC